MEDKLILLVEDNPHIMAINDAALHMRGYRTLQAETAQHVPGAAVLSRGGLDRAGYSFAGRRRRGAVPRDQTGIRCGSLFLSAMGEK
ncbi:MAG: hypothetical protein ACLRVN_00600 [Butyricicoccus sp.]